MEWNVLAVGDVVADCGVSMIEKHLPRLRRQVKADFTVVNGENAAILGITRDQAEAILGAGADVITMGNHTFGRREICPYLDDCPRILRPANLAPQLPGRGWGMFDSPMGEIAVIDLIGRCNMDYNPDNPFLLVDKILKPITTKFILVEIHAEASITPNRPGGNGPKKGKTPSPAGLAKAATHRAAQGRTPFSRRIAG